MDKEFMRAYCRNNYVHVCDIAVADSEEYRRKREVRYQMEDKMTEMLGGTGTKKYGVFDEYISAYADEMDVMLEEMYLLGAADRERMLR